MEKPPATTLGEAEALSKLAAKAGVTLFATWHSRFALGVEPARQWLSDKVIQSISIVWKEDVRRWHPGQAWIWEPGGFGVFDPGINALSILTEIVPGHIMVEKSILEFPENKKQPIAASIAMRTVEGAPVTAEFDWRQEGPQTWDITVQTNVGELRLSKGGSELYIGGEEQASGPDREYAGIYERFATLIRSRQSDTDYQPLRIVADSFLCGERKVVAPFED
jgi:D-galactose 1-dehydrogenase